MRSGFCFVLSAAGLMSALAPVVRADTLLVPDEHATIQGAINAASSGDTILVAPGTYVENVDDLGKDVTVASTDGPAVTIIDGGGVGPTLSISSLIPSTFEGFTVTNGTTGIKVITNAYATLKDMTIVGNSGWGYTNANLAYGVILADCAFLGNGSGGASISVAGDVPFAGLNVERCIFANGDTLSTSVFIFSPGTSNVRNCTFDGADLVAAEGLAIRNDIHRNGSSISAEGTLSITYSDIEGGFVGSGNIDADPLWADPSGGDYSLLPGSPCINTGSPASGLDPDGSPADMGAVVYDPWAELGGGVAGTAGLGDLAGVGPLTPAATVGVDLTGAAPSTLVTLVVGAGALGAPFKTGTMWPTLDFLLPLSTDATGAVSVSGSVPSGLPSGVSFHMQAWWVDGGAPANYAASGGLRGTVP